MAQPLNGMPGPVPAGGGAPRVYRARRVVPVAGPPIDDGAVAVRNGAIEAVGRFAETAAGYNDGAVSDLGEVVLLPGLVNAHTHLDNSAMRGRAPRGAGFIPWIEAFLRAKDETPLEIRRRATAAACAGLPALGTIAVGDISPSAFSPPFLASQPLWGQVFIEVTGFGRASGDAGLSKADRVLRQIESEYGGGRFRFAVTPHSLYSTSRIIVRAILGRNADTGRLSSLHLAESPAEVRFLTGESEDFAEAVRRWGYWEDGWEVPRLRPLGYLDKLGGLRPGVVAVHCVQLSGEEIELLTLSGCAVCLCPRSNDYIGVGQPRVADLLAAGVDPCLGTDGLGSVETLSLFDEMAFVRARHPGVEPAALLRMATLYGARALRIDGRVGSLAPGRIGRFLAYSGDAVGDPLEALTSGIDHSRLFWVGGDVG